MKKGIDVSHYQKKIDWAKVKNVVDYAIMKIGEGRYSNQKDEYFERNYTECKRLEIPVGVYSYAYAQSVTEAKEEAKRVMEWLNGRDLDLPVYYDLEDARMQKLGRKLLSSEIVHHIDGNKLNNDPSNLTIVSRSKHIKIHRKDLKEGHEKYLENKCQYKI